MSVCAPVQDRNDVLVRSPHRGELAGDESMELGGVGLGVLNMPRGGGKPKATLRWVASRIGDTRYASHGVSFLLASNFIVEVDVRYLNSAKNFFKYS